jgi:hypothetical protein
MSDPIEAIVGMFATNEGDEAMLRKAFAAVGTEACAAGRLAGFEEGLDATAAALRNHPDRLRIAASLLTVEDVARALPRAINFRFLPPRIVSDRVWLEAAADVLVALSGSPK